LGRADTIPLGGLRVPVHSSRAGILGAPAERQGAPFLLWVSWTQGGQEIRFH
jgi:hypothetical protein